MKKIILLAIMILSIQSMAQDILSCNLNRSYELIIAMEKEEMVISKKYWSSDDKIEIVRFQNPYFIKYGNTEFFIGDHGRSGYFFLKVTQADNDWWIGNMDINLFNAEPMINTDGVMRETHCRTL